MGWTPCGEIVWIGGMEDGWMLWNGGMDRRTRGFVLWWCSVGLGWCWVIHGLKITFPFSRRLVWVSQSVMSCHFMSCQSIIWRPLKRNEKLRHPSVLVPSSPIHTFFRRYAASNFKQQIHTHTCAKNTTYYVLLVIHDDKNRMKLHLNEWQWQWLVLHLLLMAPLLVLLLKESWSSSPERNMPCFIPCS